MAANRGALTGFRAVLQKWAWEKSGFNRYGLKYHDCYYETEQVKEAIRRLPQNVQDERTFRMVRALQLSMQKTVLPKEQWTKFEEDDYYLKPYLEEVLREEAEKKEWQTK